jgi:hypothetical protein
MKRKNDFFTFATVAFLGPFACAAPPRSVAVTPPPNYVPKPPPATTDTPTSSVNAETTVAPSDGGKSTTVSPPLKEPVAETVPSDEWQYNKEPVGAVSDDEFRDFPEGWVIENISTTPVTVLAHVTAGKVLSDPQHPRDFYVNHLYEAEVLEGFRGKVANRITFSVMAESNNPLRMPTYPIVISLCGNEQRGYYVPDNGYEFPAAPKILGEARTAAKQTSVQRHPTTACQ